jgi:lysophospholipase L1-like esterase
VFLQTYFFLVFAYPSVDNDTLVDLDPKKYLDHRSVASGTLLRILPLGASITYGLKSSDGNGYRLALLNKLKEAGNPVHFVGTQYGGSMENNQNEGYIGKRILEVKGFMGPALNFLPNVVLILLGTNDAVQNFEISKMGDSMGATIDQILASIPDVAVFVTKLPPNTVSSQSSQNIVIFNDMLDRVVKIRGGKNVAVVDAYSIISPDELQDGTHPTEAGYMKLAEMFYQGITRHASMIKKAAPAPPGTSDTDNGSGGGDNNCQKILGNALGPIKTQLGSGTDDGKYKHVGISKGLLNNLHKSVDGLGVVFADLTGDGKCTSL